MGPGGSATRALRMSGEGLETAGNEVFRWRSAWSTSTSSPSTSTRSSSLIRINHLGSVAEPGNVRFDVLRSTDDPTRFLLYEWYATDEAAAAHRETPHYKAWVAAATEWLAKPRHADVYEALLPEA